MILIKDLVRCRGIEIEGVFSLADYQSRTDRFGHPFQRVTLEDSSGRLLVNAWPGKCQCSNVLEIGKPVYARLITREFLGNLIGDASVLMQFVLPVANSTELLPPFNPGLNGATARLQAFIEHCPVPVLKTFLTTVFADADLTRAFVGLPASQSHHHAYPGGLADHSLEVAQMVECAPTQEEPELGVLASVAGLLHDIGKIRELQADGRRTQLGHVLRHYVMTLEILAPALKQLDSVWPDGAIALRYLLTWKSHLHDPHPLLPLVDVLQCADKYSAAVSARARAFEGKRGWQRFVRLDIPGPPSRFWRPKLLKTCEV